MKVKTSITLSEDLINNIDEFLGKRKNRSGFIEKAVRHYIERQAYEEKNIKDLEILNKKADKLNREAEDVLSYQVKL